MPTTTIPQDTDDRLDEELSVTAELESNRVLQKIREKTDAVVESIQPRIAAVSDYARSEPTKAVLIAAATGAGLMALLALIVRANRPTPLSSGQRTMAAIRDAAIDLADRAHSVAAGALGTASSALGSAHDRATSAIGSVHKRASSALDSAEDTAAAAQERLDASRKRAAEMADSVSETWASLRDQAAPVVERLRPQFDAAMAYAKDDPTKAALGVAAAGAVLVGLVALAPPLNFQRRASDSRQDCREAVLTRFAMSGSVQATKRHLARGP